MTTGQSAILAADGQAGRGDPPSHARVETPAAGPSLLVAENPAPAASGQAAGVGVHVRKVSKQFGQRQVLHGIDLEIAPGQFVAIVGKSGCGKSTLLRLLSGLDGVSRGEIDLDGSGAPAVASPDVRIMYQDARLLPWQKVEDNVALGLPGGRARRRAQAREALLRVGLADRAQEWPGVLSGGQRQRVALARALAHSPRLLLLDEPLGALDALTRIEMQSLIEQLWLAQRFTAVLVTHDVAEAIALADRVILIEQGAVALDLAIDLPRPRRRGDAAYAALEGRVLAQLLRPAAAAADTAAARQARDAEAAGVSPDPALAAA